MSNKNTETKIKGSNGGNSPFVTHGHSPAKISIEKVRPPKGGTGETRPASTSK